MIQRIRYIGLATASNTLEFKGNLFPLRTELFTTYCLLLTVYWIPVISKQHSEQ